MQSLQQLPASSSTSSRSLMWLCCAAQPLADDDPDPFTPSMGLQVVSRSPLGYAHAPDSQPVLSPKDPSAAAAAAAAAQGLTQQQQYQQQQEQQVVVINADASPRPGPPSTSPLAAAAAAAAAGDTSSNNNWQPQQQHQHLLLACQSRLSVDVHTLASGRSSTAADAVANAACSLDRLSSSLVPLTQDSLSTTTAAAAATAAGMLGPHPATTMHRFPADQGSEHHDSKGSPSEVQSDTQLHSKALYSSSSSASTTLQPQPLASSLDSTTLEPQDASILPEELAASILPSTATSSSDTERKQQLLNPVTAHNPLWQQDHQAGDHEQQQQQQQLLLSVEQQQQQGLQHCSNTPDICSCQATTSSVAGWTDIIPLLPSPPPATASNSTQGLENSAQAAFDPHADDSPLALPPGLAAKLRKLESGLSFRMLQPELPVSIRASDSLPAHSTAGVSDNVTTAGVSDHSVTTAPVSETHSGPVSGPVSRRSTAGFSPGVLSLGGLNPAGTDEQLPASIPEHNSVTGPSGEAVPTAAAVAAAFEGDAAAVQGLVDAAAAAVPVPKPHHSRSKSAGVLSTPSARPTRPTAAGPARASTPTAAAAAAAAAAAVPVTGGVAAVAAAGAPGAASSSMRPVSRTLSVSSSPFAKMDLQQAVTASLLRATAAQPPRVAAAASPAAPAALAGPPAAARQSRRSLDAAMLANASAAALRPSSSSRSMPYGLTAQQQNSQVSHTLPGQNSLRPSMTSRLSWASTVTVFEPQSHIFTLLDSGSVTNIVSNDVSDEADDNAARILRPSKSMSSLPSFKGRTISSGGSVSSMKRGKGLFSLHRVKSSAALVGVLKSTFSQPRASAAAAGKAGPGLDAAALPAARLNSSSSSSSDSRGGLAPVASAPAAAPSPLRSILRRPSNVSSTSKQSSTWAADAARHTQTSLFALDHPPQQQQQQQQQQLQQQQVLLPASHSSRPSITSGAGSPFAALPPLPRPASSHSLEAAAAAAAAASPGIVGPFLGGSSSSIPMLPQPLASEGPFAAPHAPPPELMPAGSSLQPGSSSAGLSTAQHSMQQQGSVASAPLQVLREVYSTGASSIGQLSSSGSSSGAGGSLMSLAVTRMHSAAASCGNIAAAAAAAGANRPPAKSSRMPSMGSLDTANTSSSKSSSTAIARAFAEAFLAALAAGNTRWASEAAVGQLLHETAKMMGLDKQLYAGKTAIIRRLNGGMEQLVKMAQATAADSEGDDAAATAADGVAALARKLPKPLLSVTCPDPKAKPSQVEAVYVFKWGIRRFTMKDEFIVREGQILAAAEEPGLGAAARASNAAGTLVPAGIAMPAGVLFLFVWPQ